MGNINFPGIDTSKCPALNNLAGDELVNQYFEDLIAGVTGVGSRDLSEDECEMVENALRQTCPACDDEVLDKILKLRNFNSDSEAIESLSDESVKALDGRRSCRMLKDCKLGSLINNLIESANNYEAADSNGQGEQDALPTETINEDQE